MLKFAKVAEIGDVIRAYDFKPMVGRGDSYCEGKVITKGDLGRGYDAYCIKVTKSVFGGEEDRRRVGELVYVPFETDFMEYDARIMNLSC